MNYLKTFGQIGITVIVLGLFAYFIDLRKVATLVLTAKTTPLLVAGFLIISTYLPLALRWQALSSESSKPDMVSSLKVVAISGSLNSFLPWNSGDLAKPKTANRLGSERTESYLAGIVGLERTMDLTALSVIGFLGILLSGSSETFVRPMMLGLAASVALFGMRNKQISDLIPEKYLQGFGNAVKGFKSVSKSSLAVSLTLSLFRWLLEAAALYYVLASLSIDIDPFSALFMNSAVSFVALLPISPAGFGPADATAAGILSIVGFTLSEAAAVVLLWRFLGIATKGVLGTAVLMFFYE